jgi:hypothetical protein
MTSVAVCICNIRANEKYEIAKNILGECVCPVGIYFYMQLECAPL